MKNISKNIYHVPVLLHESIDALSVKPGGVYIDVTFGGGGHSNEILRRLAGNGRLFAFDQDADAIKRGERREKRGEDILTLVHANFRHLWQWMRYYNVTAVDGILADLGVSSHHFDTAERGFSFRSDAPLDMRMNQQAALTAADVVNTYSEEQLCTLFRLYGELRMAHRLAAIIVRERTKQPVTTTGKLATLTENILRTDRQKKELAKVFQALRIEVNGEMEALGELLTASARLLRPGGKLVVITYHSLEDRLVKNFIRSGNIEGTVKEDIFGNKETPFTTSARKMITPDTEEVERNPRSRSAKMRVAVKSDNTTNTR